MRSGVRLEASDARVDSALDPIDPNESALSLALRAYLFACALGPGVLLSPVSILLAGFGARRAFDGRVRQPGRGLVRPRGIPEGEPIVDAARVAIPSSLPAVFVAWGYALDPSRASVLSVAAGVARKSGSNARAEVLTRAASQGATVFRGSAVERELLRVAAPAHGGLVGEEDFSPPADLDHAASSNQGLALPWEDAARAPRAQTILATDRRGTAVAVCYEDAVEGLPLFAGELICPLLAVPVMRGVPRVRPGEPLPQACSARVTFDEDASRVLSVTAGGLSLAVPD
jgi:hypothetical protein